MAMPENIVLARIDPHSGALALPGGQDAFFEYFRKRFLPRHHAAPNDEALNPYGTI